MRLSPGRAAAAAINRRPDLPPYRGGFTLPRLPSSPGGAVRTPPPSKLSRGPGPRAALQRVECRVPAEVMEAVPPRRHTASAPARSRLSRGESFLTSARAGGGPRLPAGLAARRAGPPLLPGSPCLPPPDTERIWKRHRRHLAAADGACAAALCRGRSRGHARGAAGEAPRALARGGRGCEVTECPRDAIAAGSVTPARGCPDPAAAH